MHTLWTILPIAAALADLVAMAIVLLRSTNRSVTRSFVLMAGCIAAWDLQLPIDSSAGVGGTHVALVHLVRSLAIFVPATIFHTAFACADSGARRRPTLVWIGYGISAVLAVLQTQGLVSSGFVIYSWGAVPRPALLFPALVAFAFIWMGLGVFYCARTLRQPVTPELRLRAKYWLLAAATALPVRMTEFLAHYGWPILPIWSSGSFCIAGLVAYAALRRRLMDLDVFVTKAFAVLAAGVVIALPVAAVTASMLDTTLNVVDCLALGLVTMGGIITTLVFPEFRAHLERSIERSLFPARRAARDAILRFSHDVVKLSCRADLGTQLLRTLHGSLQLKGAALYLRAEGAGKFALACAEGEIASPPCVRADHWLDAHGPSAPGSSLMRLGPEHAAASSRFAAEPLDWEACVPVWAEDACLALIGLAAKRSGANFNDTDTTLLTVLSAQLAIALKNADYVHEIERQKAAIEELQQRLAVENVTLRARVQSVSQFKEIIGSSGALQRALALVERAAPTDASILITGETGTGKELIARAIHELSPRRHGPMICVNCSAIPRELAEAELFGHQRGAFTDAVADRPGSFEIADGGTVFLDEIGDLPFELQAKLLRVLQERVVQRIGGQRLYRLDLRVVAATNRDLRAEMRAQRFREDLYYRLATVVVEVPPLRERIEDIPMLASYFLERAATSQCTAKGFTSEAMDALRRYSWPGNIRELQNVVERAVLLCTSEAIRPEHLSDLATPPPPPSFGRAIREEKRRRIERALAQTGGNQAAAARLLGITPSNLARTMKSVGAKLPSSLQ